MNACNLFAGVDRVTVSLSYLSHDCIVGSAPRCSDVLSGLRWNFKLMLSVVSGSGLPFHHSLRSNHHQLLLRHSHISWHQTETMNCWWHGWPLECGDQGHQQLPGAAQGQHWQLGVQALLQVHHQPPVGVQCADHGQTIVWVPHPMWQWSSSRVCGERCPGVLLLDVFIVEHSSKVQRSMFQLTNNLSSTIRLQSVNCLQLLLSVGSSVPFVPCNAVLHSKVFMRICLVTNYYIIVKAAMVDDGGRSDEVLWKRNNLKECRRLGWEKRLFGDFLQQEHSKQVKCNMKHANITFYFQGSTFISTDSFSANV